MIRVRSGNSVESVPSSTYGYLTDYLARVPAELLAGFSEQQQQVIQSIVISAIPKPAPKIVDLRFTINLLFSRFYIVLFVGKDRRRSRRRHVPAGVSRIGNIIVAIFLLVGANLCASFFIFMALYLLKSWVGINVFKELHLIDVLNYVLG